MYHYLAVHEERKELVAESGEFAIFYLIEAVN